MYLTYNLQPLDVRPVATALVGVAYNSILLTQQNHSPTYDKTISCKTHFNWDPL